MPWELVHEIWEGKRRLDFHFIKSYGQGSLLVQLHCHLHRYSAKTRALLTWFGKIFFFLEGLSTIIKLNDLVASKKASMFSRFFSSCPWAWAFCFDVTNRPWEQSEAVVRWNHNERAENRPILFLLQTLCTGWLFIMLSCVRSHLQTRALPSGTEGSLCWCSWKASTCRRSHSSPSDDQNLFPLFHHSAAVHFFKEHPSSSSLLFLKTLL